MCTAIKEKEFDKFLGESHAFTHKMSILNMVTARAKEITAMTYSIENPEQTKLLFQKLPVYMRRRVMSHNIKRLPHRLRQAHLNQLVKSRSSDLPPKIKRPRGKHRKRPSNLLAEYNRRQRDNWWLETHVWHAKRFHMINKWEYRIANLPNDKCFKANYRASMDGCLLQDLSYYICVEIKGEENFLKKTLKMHCNPTALSFIAIKYTGGRNEGTVMFYRKDGYPRFPIGNVHFLWKSHESPDVRTIWIWVHPAFYTEFFSEIKSTFGFRANGEEAADARSSNILYTSDTGCEMTINKLNRFRLLGPLLLKVLTEVLRLPSLTKSDSCSETNHELSSIATDRESSSCREKLNEGLMQNDTLHSTERMEIDEANEVKIPSSRENNEAWHTKYCEREENMRNFITQKQWWENLSKEKSLRTLPNSVIGLTVLDPRFYFPKKRTECETGTAVHLISPLSVPQDLNHSPIWDAQIRHIVSNSCVSMNTINNLRSMCLVPGVANDRHFSQDVIARIPVLLIPKLGKNREIVGHGIDLIIPANWAMPFLLALVLRCVRLGALRETKTVAFEGLNTFTPDVNDPDTPAYAREALTTRKELCKKYFRRPPNNRVNFIKLGISNPFFCDWRNLMKDWSDTEDFYVLRNREQLLLLQTGICSHSSNKDRFSNRHSESSQADFQADLNEYKNCLVRIKVSMMNKGSPKDFAIVCMPTSEDLENLNNNKKWNGPIEKCHKDPNEATRVTLRTDHLLKLRRLKRQRVRRRKEMESGQSKLLEKSIGNSDDKCSANSESHRKMIEEQWERMSRLWLPETTRVRYSCGREVMGYLTTAGYSLSHAKGIGIGYVALPSLIELINKKTNIILVRNIQTRQYRLATCDILHEDV